MDETPEPLTDNCTDNCTDSAGAATVVSIKSPSDILGVLPHRLGFVPEESLVVVCLYGPRRRDQLVMRVDLPPREHEGDFCAELARQVCDVGAEAVLLVCYTEERPPAAGLVRAPFLRRLRRALDRSGVDVLEMLLVRDGRWFSYLCANRACCPEDGTPLSAQPTPATLAVAAESVLRGRVTWESRSALSEAVEMTDEAAATRAFDSALDGVTRALTDTLICRGPAALQRQVLGTVESALARAAEGQPPLTTEEVAVLALGLRGAVTRDRVLTLICDHDPRPLAGVFTDVVQRTPDALAAPACTVLAFFAYAAGEGALANVALDRALRVEPGYYLAELLQASLRQLLSPSAVRELATCVRADLEQGRPRFGDAGPVDALAPDVALRDALDELEHLASCDGCDGLGGCDGCVGLADCGCDCDECAALADCDCDDCVELDDGDRDDAGSAGGC